LLAPTLLLCFLFVFRAQFVLVMLVLFTLTLPLLVLAYVSNKVLAVVLTIITVATYWTVNEVARDVEDPFLYGKLAVVQEWCVTLLSRGSLYGTVRLLLFKSGPLSPSQCQGTNCCSIVCTVSLSQGTAKEWREGVCAAAPGSSRLRVCAPLYM
jgi:hypothetical protein